MNAEKIFALDSEIRTTYESFQKNELKLLELFQEMNLLSGFHLLGFASLWEYAVKGLQMTESQASAYITVARKAMEVPALEAALQSGDLTVSKAKRITA